VTNSLRLRGFAPLPENRDASLAARSDARETEPAVR
jgi:hypothetical protein